MTGDNLQTEGIGQRPVFLLLAGAWHASWCWERVVPLLEAAGASVLSSDLAGVGHTPAPVGGPSLVDWVEQVAAILDCQDRPVVLVGHSRAGIVLSAVAERCPERIRSLVYVAAFLVPSGASAVGIIQTTPGMKVDGLISMQADGTSLVTDALVGPVLYNRTDDVWLQRALANIGAEPMGPMMTPVRTTFEQFGSVPRAYVECLDDRIIPLGAQRAMQAALPCDPVFTIDTDHSPFFSAPDALADALLRVAQLPFRNLPGA